ncbi:MAG: porin [Planctomycetaceae bacterium]|jgi:hypothetical protein|nr:porin [Planctomycetaceae bacterium]
MKRKLLGGFGVIVAFFALQFVQTEIQAGLFDLIKPCAAIGECNPCDKVYDTGCDPCADIDACYAKVKKSQWFANGYFEVGFFANEYGQKNHYLANPTERTRAWIPQSGNTSYLQHNANTGIQLNQLYISVGRAVDGKHGLDVGGTVDFTFGTDAQFVQAAGLEFNDNFGTKESQWGSGDYYSSFAQAFIEVAYKRWNIKVGKVYSPFGSNGYKSTDRFFYSVADTYAMVPATALAAYATYTVNNNLSVYGGWVQPDQFGETSENNALLFGFDWNVGKRLTLSYAYGAGTDKRGRYDVDYFVQSLVTKYKINSRLTSIFDWTVYNISQNPDYDTAGVYGINTELIYQYNSQWAFGFRAGWGRDINNFFYGINNQQTYDNKYTFSLGANWTPLTWLTIKTELRYDKFEDTEAFNRFASDGSLRPDCKTDQFSGGMSAIVKF